MILHAFTDFLRTRASLCDRMHESVKICKKQLVCKKKLPRLQAVCKIYFTRFLRTRASLCSEMRECVKVCEILHARRIV